ncbi:endonuclease V [Persephonella sp.]
MEGVDDTLIQKLKAQQLELAQKLNLKDRIPVEEIKTVAGVDVTFTNIWSTKTTGIACITVLDITRNFETVETVYAVKEVDFPYIPTFLAYRELPVIMEAYKKLSSRPDAFILDGMGILHPRKMGIAAHFGVVTDTISVGCGKSRLTGEFEPPENKKFAFSPVYIDRELRGYAVRTKKNANPVFISPGNNISVESSLKLLFRTTAGYKLPEPTRRAHNLLQKYRKQLIGSSHV